MRPIYLTLAAVAAFWVVSSDGLAADYELVGFTTASFDGGETIRGFAAACQAEFSANTRMCTSVEVMETVNWPSLPALSQAWTRPVFAGQDPQGIGLMDASGQLVGGAGNGDGHCGQWQSAAPNWWGLIAHYPSANSSGYFSTLECFNLRPVACCGPVPSSTMAFVPSILWFGRGLLAAMILSAAGFMVYFRGRPALGTGGRNLLGAGRRTPRATSRR